MSTAIRIVAGGRPAQTVVPQEVQLRRPLTGTLAQAGFVLNTRCGERGLCRGCELESSNGLRMKACQVVTEDVQGLTLTIPPQSLLTGRVSIVADFRPRCEFELNPTYRRPMADAYGLCVDIGTTTVVLAAVRLSDGKVIGKASHLNAQVRMGDDVMTRIGRCADADELAEARRLLFSETLLPAWKELRAAHGLEPLALAGVVVAGNTTMLHIFAGEDPSGMGSVPFAPRFLGTREIANADLPLEAEWGELQQVDVSWLLLPGFGAFVGADIAAGWMASGMVDAVGPTLLIDLGTNGEMVVHVDGKLLACATAAGPAFEGVQLRWGTRAVEGSVSRIHGPTLAQRSSALALECIGGRCPRARGFCGSAYMDFLALGWDSGLLTGRGRFDRKVASSSGVELVETEDGLAWPLDPEQPAGPSISEADIALLLQAKAAIAAGVDILLKQAGITRAQIERLYLAGGFGLNLDITSAIGCGLLAGFEARQVEVIGNSSLCGAYICLLDQVRLEELGRATSSVRIIELNTDPDFEDCYIDRMGFGDS
jgi:uncharacterized 2Fe-2S/4Fe-4S cluster protein (DUF4445 family)